MNVALNTWGLLCVVALLTACASGGLNRAPVEERAGGARPNPGAASPTSNAPISGPAPVATAPAPAAVGGAENAGKPGYYTVKPGDTLRQIALDSGQAWRDLVRWNSIDNPDRIEVGLVLRVLPPGTLITPETTGAVTRPVAPASAGVARPLDARAAVAAAAASAPPPSTAATTTTAAAPRSSDEDLGWAWPAIGPVAAQFEEGKNKGLVITGKAGDPVLAAADGRVVYAGSGLRGYGNLIIVKHNDTFLTAYAHNQALLVKDDQAVRRGQRIAEMGSSDAERVQLHFEIRRLGKPIDPTKLLPQR